MSYATLADLFDRFGEDEIIQLTDSDGAGSPNRDTVDRALADVGAEIDAALIGRYKLPMAPVPDLLTRIACDLAREAFYTDTLPEVVKTRAATARKLLGQIAAGALRLGTAEAAPKDAIKSDAKLVKRRKRWQWPGGAQC